jgi:hypothetical protein
VQKKGNDVSKGFVEGEHVRVCAFLKTWMETVKQRMRRFVGDNIMRDRTEDL